MARSESKAIMGYLPIEERHYLALLSLVTPATPVHRLLDPFAGEGAFLEAAARTWNMTPYANELDGERAAQCLARFGPKQAVRCDVERLVASSNAFALGWFNPPYDHDAAASGSKRIEFRYLRHAWKWIQDGGLVLWAIYRQHLTEKRYYSPRIAVRPAPAGILRYRTRSRCRGTSSRPGSRGQNGDLR